MYESAFLYTLEKVIGTNALVSHGIANHEVSESVDVTRRPDREKTININRIVARSFVCSHLLEDFLGSDVRAIDFEHAFGENEVFTPESEQVGLHRTTGRTVVIETGDTTIDGERWSVEESSLQKILEIASLVLVWSMCLKSIKSL